MCDDEPLVTFGPEARAMQERRLRERMAQIRRRLAIVSGKGGVGKSTAATNLAVALASRWHSVGLIFGREGAVLSAEDSLSCLCRCGTG